MLARQSWIINKTSLNFDFDFDWLFHIYTSIYASCERSHYKIGAQKDFRKYYQCTRYCLLWLSFSYDRIENWEIQIQKLASSGTISSWLHCPRGAKYSSTLIKIKFAGSFASSFHSFFVLQDKFCQNNWSFNNSIEFILRNM